MGDELDYTQLMEGEWTDLSFEGVLGLMAELDDWRTSRTAGGYDTRLLSGAIVVCKSWLDQYMKANPRD